MNKYPLLFCFWTGSNKMSSDREKCFNSLKNSDLEILLINKNNLNDLIKFINVPLHKGFEYLSFVHKCDYLRCYVSHHLGGAYSDIKYIDKSWLNEINEFYKNKNEWILGYKEIPDGYAITKNPLLNIELKNNWFKLIGLCNFVTKAKTPFTTEWYSNMIKLMDDIYEDLKKYPARHPLEVYAENYKYPLKWTELLGDIFHPLCLKYYSHINQNLPKFKLIPYR
jgi:hypothetical protein